MVLGLLEVIPRISHRFFSVLLLSFICFFMLILLISFSIWEDLFFSLLNKKHLSFQLRKVVCSTNFIFMREAEVL